MAIGYECILVIVEYACRVWRERDKGGWTEDGFQRMFVVQFCNQGMNINRERARMRFCTCSGIFFLFEDIDTFTIN